MRHDGPGRLAGVEAIARAVTEVLGLRHDLVGETLLVTAGPTRENIDPVRYLTNRSSGRMGYAVADAAAHRGARVAGERPNCSGRARRRRAALPCTAPKRCIAQSSRGYPKPPSW